MAEYVTLARPYAKAAFDFAKSTGLVDSWMQQLTVSAAIASISEVAQSFSSPDKNNDQLVGILVGTDADDGYKNLISLMADNNRLELLPDVVNVFAARYERIRIHFDAAILAWAAIISKSAF